MATKNTYQNTLKKEFGVNKNISEALTEEQCKELLERLKTDDGTLNLVRSFIGKNKELSQNNSKYGRQREQAKKALAALQTEFDEYKVNGEAPAEKVDSGELKSLQDENEKLKLELAALKAASEDVSALQEENTQLRLEQSTLRANNEELMRDNRHLSNLVQFIKLRTTQAIKGIITRPNADINKELAELLESTLG